jgi:hypothetical protein
MHEKVKTEIKNLKLSQALYTLDTLFIDHLVKNGLLDEVDCLKDYCDHILNSPDLEIETIGFNSDEKCNKFLMEHSIEVFDFVKELSERSYDGNMEECWTHLLSETSKNDNFQVAINKLIISVFFESIYWIGEVLDLYYNNQFDVMNYNVL